MHRILTFFRLVVLALVGGTLAFEYTAVNVGGFAITPNKAISAILLGFVALQWATERRHPPRDEKSPWVLFFGIAVSISAVQSVFGGLPVAPVGRVLLTQYSLILFYFMINYTLATKKQLDLLLFAVVLSSAAAAISGWFGFGEQERVESMYGARLTGEGANPNLLAFNLLLSIAVVASFAFSSRALLVRAVCVGLAGLMLVAVLSTLSRTAYVSLFGMIALWAIRFRRVDFLKYALPMLALFAILAAYTPAAWIDRLATLSPERLEEDRSSMGRVVMWEDTWRAFSTNPITGVGLLGFIPWAAEDPDARPSTIHSSYLQVLAENGLVGLVPFLVIHVLAWRELTRAWRTARRYRGLGDRELHVLELRAVLLQVALGSTYFMGLAQPSLRHKGLWLLLSLTVVMGGLVRERVRELTQAEAAEPDWQAESAYAFEAPRPSLGPAAR
jgi:O-antigen ligase